MAVDEAIAAGLVSRQLPNIRREAVRLVSAHHPTQEEGDATIERELRNFLQGGAGTIDPHEMARSVEAVRALYRRNVFPSMKVTFGTYPTNRGHTSATGCFRCHDDLHAAKDGSVISGDCEYCHKEITP
jgi:hypothetical protein